MTLCTCANRGICLSCQLTELKLEQALTDSFLADADRGLGLIESEPDNVVYLPERRGWSVKA